jgi:hypothetical protein
MKTKNLLLLIAAIIALSFFLGRWSTSGLRSAQYDEISELRDVMKIYQVELRDREQTIYEKDQILGTQREAIKAGLIDNELLKALNIKQATQVTTLKGQLAAARDSIDLSGNDSIVFVTDTVAGNAENYIKLPFSWPYSDEYLQLTTGIRENKQAWFNLNAALPLTITMGGKDGRQVAAVSTPSPYVSITDFNVVNVQKQNFFYKHQWIPWTGGFVGGVAAGWAIWGR